MLRTLAAALAAATALGGCVMRTDEPATRGEEFQRTQRVALDLREPPTRAEAGIEDGRGSLIVERRGAEPLDVELTLPNDAVLALPAIGVVFSAPPDDPAGPVESVTVNRTAASLAEARDMVLGDARALGIDAADVERHFGAARPAATRVFRGARIGYLLPEVEVRHDASGVAVDYTLIWGNTLDPAAPSP